ncbi:hypothetical protein EG68_12167 [Paragonimus skrjabini miyazakii]|uniref:DUF4806 domain-containing protein n=1 Tax=Paragonimus skrjabini miyazakii TaxID=59628 RepID=A0A8S9YD41_9TREM|nr:hypothetical protein EG68_12167 [Paragonimus skrjabini miyazakii]
MTDGEVELVPVSTTTETSPEGPAKRKSISRRILRPWERSHSYIDARAVEQETVEQSSDATSDCTTTPVPPNPQAPASKYAVRNSRFPRTGFDSLQNDTTIILDLVRGIVSTSSNVTSRLQALETQMTRSFPPPTSSKPAVMPAMFRSPARTQEELDEREAELANSQVYDVVLKSLCRMGGTDVADTIRRMMSFLIHNNLAVLMNWSGVCNKRAACDLLSMELVQDAIPSQQRYADVSGAELLVHMRRWYRNARDRAGGRTKRITKPPKSKDVFLDVD